MQSCIFIRPQSILITVSCNLPKLKTFRTKQALFSNISILSKALLFYFTKFKTPKSLVWFYSLFSFQILSMLSLKCLHVSSSLAFSLPSAQPRPLAAHSWITEATTYLASLTSSFLLSNLTFMPLPDQSSLNATFISSLSVQKTSIAL